MIAASADTLVAIFVPVGVLIIGAVLAVIAWFFRQWANRLSDDVKELGKKVDKLDDRADDQTNAIGQLQVAVGWPPHLRIESGRR